MHPHQRFAPESQLGNPPVGSEHSTVSLQQSLQLDVESFLGTSRHNGREVTHAPPVQTSDETAAALPPEKLFEYLEWLDALSASSNTNPMPPSSARHGPIPSSRLTPLYSDFGSPTPPSGTNALNDLYSGWPSDTLAHGIATATPLHAPQVPTVSGQSLSEVLQNHAPRTGSSYVPLPHQPQPMKSLYSSYPSPIPSPFVSQHEQFVSTNLVPPANGPSVNRLVAWTAMGRPPAGVVTLGTRNNTICESRQRSMRIDDTPGVSFGASRSSNPPFMPRVKAQQPVGFCPSLQERYKASTKAAWSSTSLPRPMEFSEPAPHSFPSMQTPMASDLETSPLPEPNSSPSPASTESLAVSARCQSSPTTSSTSSIPKRRKRSEVKDEMKEEKAKIPPYLECTLVSKMGPGDRVFCTCPIGVTEEGYTKVCSEWLLRMELKEHFIKKHDGRPFTAQNGETRVFCGWPECQAQTDHILESSMRHHAERHLGLHDRLCPTCPGEQTFVGKASADRHTRSVHMKNGRFDGGLFGTNKAKDERPRKKRQRKSIISR